jgi:CRISPR-associated protein (TIGR02710 family)
MKTMLISVGGAETPVILSIKNHLPEKIIFFVSKGSRTQVSEKIMPAIFADLGKMLDHEFVVTPDEHDIGESTGVLLSEVPKAMRKLGRDAVWADIVDYTGGTKAMSAAVVWASSKFPCLFNYVGGTERSKNGLGIVVDGAEKHVTLQNPWDRLAYFEINDALKMFDCGQYANSAELFAKIAEKVTDERAKREFSVLQGIVEGYSQWDMFNHEKALSLFSKNLPRLKDIAETESFYLPKMKDFTERTDFNFKFLQDLKAGGKLSWFLIHDLLVNALRRSDLEKKYEDATARTYAAIEKIAKLQLHMKHQLNNAKCRPEQIPDKLRAEYAAKYSDSAGFLKFGSIASYELLLHLGDIYGQRFAELVNVREHMTERNNSILGHGICVIDREKFTLLFNDAMKILKIEISDLPVFPKFMEEGKRKTENKI